MRVVSTQSRVASGTKGFRLRYIMFTKHLEGLDIPDIIKVLQSVGVEGADLCVRPGYPVNPENADKALPAAARQFADEGLSIPLVTLPTSFTDPEDIDLQRVYAACGEAGVANAKGGYWHWSSENGGYWGAVDRIRKQLEGFQELSAKHGVRSCLHNHSGVSMGLNSAAVMNLVKGFDPQHVGVFADTGHLSIVGEPINMALDIVKDYLAVVSFKDMMRFPGMHRGHVVPMKYGFVDWETAVRTLTEIGFNGPISFHSEYKEPVDTVIDLARIDVRYINSLLDEISK